MRNMTRLSISGLILSCVMGCKSASGPEVGSELESSGRENYIKFDMKSDDKKELPGVLYKMLMAKNNRDAMNEDSGASGDADVVSVEGGNESITCKKSSGKFTCSFKIAAKSQYGKNDKNFETPWNDQRQFDQNFPMSLWRAIASYGPDKAKKDTAKLDDNEGNSISCDRDRDRAKCSFSIALKSRS